MDYNKVFVGSTELKSTKKDEFLILSVVRIMFLREILIHGLQN